MDVIGSYRAKKRRRDGLSFRTIAGEARSNPTRIRKSLRDAPKGRMRRELRQEVRQAGGLRSWWDGG
jgi:hypothetical protein